MREVMNAFHGEPACVKTQRLNNTDVYVVLTQYGSSMTFHHPMTPAQARQLAAYLTECADLLEPRQMPEGVPV